MEIIQEKEISRRGLTLAERLRRLEKKQKLAERAQETKAIAKEFKFPLLWRWKFFRSRRISSEEVLVIFLNKKNQIEPPRFMPIYDGNMVVWKNKPYEFDPRAIWTVKGIRKNPQVYLIKEIDRRPVRNHKGQIVYKDAAVSNMDLDEIRARGDSTESDEFLIKASLKAQTSTIKRNINIVAVIIIAILLIGGVLWFLFGG
ncbi:MAG: hypothetical protein ACOC5T_02190 [Elusimicrobiota bacterium]